MSGIRLAALAGAGGAACAAPGRCAGAWSARGAARRGPARTATGRSSRATPTSPDRRGSPPAAGRRSARGCARRSSRACTSPRSRRLVASFAALGRRRPGRRWPEPPRPGTPGRRCRASSSRLIVAGRPSSRAIARTPRPAGRSRMISSRSSKRQVAANRLSDRHRVHPASLDERLPAPARRPARHQRRLLDTCTGPDRPPEPPLVLTRQIGLGELRSSTDASDEVLHRLPRTPGDRALRGHCPGADRALRGTSRRPSGHSQTVSCADRQKSGPLPLLGVSAGRSRRLLTCSLRDRHPRGPADRGRGPGDRGPRRASCDGLEATAAVSRRGHRQARRTGRSPASTRSSCARSRLVGPVADQHGGDRVAGEVGQRARLGHEPVDADDQADAVDAARAGASCRPPARVARPAPVTPAAPFEAMIMNTSSEICSPMRQRVAQRLGDEQRRHRQVDRGAVEVERVAGRDDDADGRLVDARRAPSWRSAAAAPTPRTRSRGSAGTRGRGSLNRLKMLTPVDQPEQRAEDDEDEERAGDVEARPSARARLFSASTPVSPTTAAIAPKAPIGAAHMIIARTRKTSRCRCPTPRRIGSPARPMRLQGEADEQRDQQGLQHLARGQRRRTASPG